jgi:glutathione S-transferase
MFRLYGFVTQNTLKTLYVLEEIGADYEYRYVDLGEGENRTEDFRTMAPFRKVPVLEHDGQHLFESGAICRYVANVGNSPLYPADKMPRAQVDQWMDFFSCHLGHWLNTLYFETVIKPQFNLGEPDGAAMAEATKFASIQMKIVDGLLTESGWLANDAMSIADLFAFAYVEQHRVVNFSLADYPQVRAWFDRIELLKSISDARARLPQ